MEMNRRDLLLGVGAAPLLAGAGQASGTPSPDPAVPALPDKASFLPIEGSYLNAGTTHPIPRSAKAAADAYTLARADPSSGRANVEEEGVRAAFAQLINADPADVAFVRSTTTAEHIIVDGLGLMDGRGRVVTDTLHFFGSFPLYRGIAERGTDVAWLRAVDGRIRSDDIERAITPGTTLVALSAVSTFNGFEHDLARVCEIAHARGALVYADIVHAAGCVPIDVRVTGVDFAACSSYKWLMADFGLGFVYARPSARERLRRRRFGYYGVERFASHVYPFDPPGDSVADVTMRGDATGLFATGTYSHSVIAQLEQSLAYIRRVGVDRINGHSKSLTDRLKQELPRLGYDVVTPRESRAPIVTCSLQNARALAPRLAEANVQISLSANRFRVTPTVFNDMADIERLLAALRR